GLLRLRAAGGLHGQEGGVMFATTPDAGTGLTYILPIKRDGDVADEELARYLAWLDRRAELIVVDGSDRAAFERHAREWPAARLVPPDPALRALNGKVWGVLTGLALATNDK